MSKLILLFFFFTCAVGAFSQTLKRTYYDEYKKTMLLEEYYVNSAGYGNGSYKKYWKDGNLTLKGTYKDGSKEGVWTSYSRSSGKQEVSQTETYKNNKLNGPAVYYMEGTLVKEKGNYLNDERDGEWEILQSFDSYGFPEEVRKGAKYVKGTFHYKEGKIVYPDGERKVYFYPSGKIYVHGNYLDGKMVGDQIMYNPDGTIKTQQYFDTPEEIEAKEKKKTQMIDSALVAFNNLDFELAAYYFLEVNETRDAKIMQSLNNAKSKRLAGDYATSIKWINSALNGIQNPIISDYHEEVYAEYISQKDSIYESLRLSINYKEMDKVLVVCEQEFKDGVLKKEDLDKFRNMKTNLKLEIMQLENEVDSTLEGYKKENVIQTQTLLVDADGKPVMKDSYIKGKFLYIKSMIVLDSYVQQFKDATTLVDKLKIKEQNNLTVATLNNIPESEWKDLNKQLKKIDDPEQIKAILKI